MATSTAPKRRKFQSIIPKFQRELESAEKKLADVVKLQKAGEKAVRLFDKAIAERNESAESAVREYEKCQREFAENRVKHRQLTEELQTKQAKLASLQSALGPTEKQMQIVEESLKQRQKKFDSFNASWNEKESKLQELIAKWAEIAGEQRSVRETYMKMLGLEIVSKADENVLRFEFFDTPSKNFVEIELEEGGKIPFVVVEFGPKTAQMKKIVDSFDGMDLRRLLYDVFFCSACA